MCLRLWFAGRVATRQEALGYATAAVQQMGMWDVCHLKDGQVDGRGHGGRIEDKPQAAHNCAMMYSAFVPLYDQACGLS